MPGFKITGKEEILMIRTVIFEFWGVTTARGNKSRVFFIGGEGARQRTEDEGSEECTERGTKLSVQGGNLTFCLVIAVNFGSNLTDCNGKAVNWSQNVIDLPGRSIEH
jgi:hypothetical protein